MYEITLIHKSIDTESLSVAVKTGGKKQQEEAGQQVRNCAL